MIRLAISLTLVATLSACGTLPLPASREAPNESGGGTEPALPNPARRSPFEEPPGAYSSDVTQSNIATTICIPGWTATVRPSTSFTQGVKRLMLRRASLDPADAIKYELDHYVPLAIGGHLRSGDNLWLQS